MKGQQSCPLLTQWQKKGEQSELKGPRCASVNGFSLHASTAIPAHRRDQLERLIRYTARGALSLERLEQDANGDLMYRFSRPWSDGTTGIKLSPLELLEKLAALVPLPRAHLVRYAGCLAPHSKLRAAIIPTPRQQGADGEQATNITPAVSISIPISTSLMVQGEAAWPRLRSGYGDMPILPTRFFADHCRHSSATAWAEGSARTRCADAVTPGLATFTQESVITRILRHLQLASVPPPIAPARLRQEIFVFDEAHASVGS